MAALLPIQNFGTTLEAEMVGPSEDALAGKGGGAMEILISGTREEKLNSLVRGTFLNRTSLRTPKALVPNQNFNSLSEAETELGYSVTGSAYDPLTVPLRGALTVENSATGEKIGSSSVEGTYRASFDPPRSVLNGEDGGGVGTYRVEFKPDSDGVSSTVEDAGYPLAELSTRYGYIKGVVRSFDGEPLSGEVIRSGKSTTKTNSDGEYQFLAPGGVGLDVVGLSDSITKTVQTAERSSVTKDWGYGAVKVAVQGPTGTPVQSAPVEIDGESYKTDKSGEVLLTKKPLGDVNVKIMGDIERNLSIQSEQELASTTYVGGSRVDIEVYDKTDGTPVENISLVDRENGIVSYTGSNGRGSILSIDAGEYDIRVGERDRRYRVTSVKESTADGETKTVKAFVEPRTTTTNS